VRPSVASRLGGSGEAKRTDAEPRAGFEPATSRLQGECTTNCATGASTLASAGTGNAAENDSATGRSRENCAARERGGEPADGDLVLLVQPHTQRGVMVQLQTQAALRHISQRFMLPHDPANGRTYAGPAPHP
jgi:hypothetical protein